MARPLQAEENIDRRRMPLFDRVSGKGRMNMGYGMPRTYPKATPQ